MGIQRQQMGRQQQTLYWSHAGGEDPQQASPRGWGRRGYRVWGRGEPWERCPRGLPVGGSAALLQAEAVKEVLAEATGGTARLPGPPGQAPQVGDVVSQRFDGLHLLVQVVGLKEVAEL